MSSVVSVSRAIAGAGLIGVGALHAIWASGSSWPAESSDDLADAVLGSSGETARAGTAATVAVAVIATSAGIVAAGALGDRAIAVAARRGAAAALIGRGAVGGVVACRALGLPSPGDRFRRLDSRYYRPLCLLLGTAAWLGARRR